MFKIYFIRLKLIQIIKKNSIKRSFWRKEEKKTHEYYINIYLFIIINKQQTLQKQKKRIWNVEHKKKKTHKMNSNFEKKTWPSQENHLVFLGFLLFLLLVLFGCCFFKKKELKDKQIINK